MSKLHTLAALAALAIMTLTACGGGDETACHGPADNLACDYVPISVEIHRICYENPSDPRCLDGPLASPNAATWINEIAKTGAPLADQPTDADAANTGRFLQSPATQLDSERYTLHRLTFTDGFNASNADTFNIPNNSGEVYEGVEFFTLSNNRAYVGLGRDTILGGVIRTRNVARGIWSGVIGFLPAGATDYYEGDMELFFDYASRSISATVPLESPAPADHALAINGSYDSRGVLRGTVAYGAGDTSPPTSITGARTNGILSGIIGGYGGVGLFVNRQAAYVGGFVVRPPTYGNTPNDPEPNMVNYADWAAADYRWDSARPRNDFLQNTSGSLPTTNSDGANVAIIPNTDITLNRASGTLGGDANDGVAFYGATIDGGRYYYAGVTSGTDLGAPLNNPNVNGIWRGSLQMIAEAGGVGDRAFPMELTVNLGEHRDGAGTVEAFVSVHPLGVQNPYIHIDGYFDHRGVIRGVTRYGDFNPQNKDNPPRNSLEETGILAGLIGQDGAVAVFHGTERDAQYSGGFVANNYATDGIVNYLDWTNGSGARESASASRTNQFLEVDGTGNFGGTDSPNAEYSFHLGNLGGQSADDGVAFYRNGTRAGSHYYAGVFSGANLGEPLDDGSSNVTWNGLLGYITDSGARTERNITLSVTFGRATRDANRVRVNDAAEADSRFDINGVFDSRGVISGTTTYRNTAGRLRGIIGQDGALGAFISNGSGANGYAGGFVAVNPSP